MSAIGTSDNPLRVAIVGAGPTGFYAAGHLFKQKDVVVDVDMFERLPTPFGLVRYGVAPDHQKIKSVTAVFDRTARHPRFRFFGNVEIGKDLSVADLRAHYHQIIYTFGAESDRKLGIPGEELLGNHSATEFVAWYNGHPDYVDYECDLSVERAAVVGVGNVAMDVTRILARTVDELQVTDIADYALEKLGESNIKEIVVLGRRGPAQAAFTTPEIKELGEMEDADVTIPSDEAALDPLSEAALEEAGREIRGKVEVIQSYSGRERTGKSKLITLRFLVSPVELIGDDDGRVTAMRIVHNELYLSEGRGLRPRATERTEILPVGLVFRSIGYKGTPLEGVPFNDSWGVIANHEGRVVDPAGGDPLPGEYTAGWIKRGPTGIIGTNKPDALETVNHMLTDAGEGRMLQPVNPTAEAVLDLVRQKQPDYITYADWQKLDEMEKERGAETGRVRVKFTSVNNMLAALGRG